ncbi:MAG: HTH domain-containing protein [Lachnoclostridium sp.]|nr:HTH domain-containing protein [Lachnoclostridium sp.]
MANTFFRAGYIEAWGRGIQKICEECDLIGANAPEYRILGDDITVKLTAIESSKAFNRTKDVSPNVRKNVRKGKAVNTRVFELIKVQTDISMSEIAARLGVSYKTVQRAVADLKKLGLIERVGGRKDGYWRINEDCLRRSGNEFH